MKKMLKRGLSLVLTLIMVVGLLPVTAFAKVDNNTGYPQDLDNKLVLSIYTTEGTFPGEPATHGSSEYVSFNSNFAKTSASGQFKASAEDELSPSILDKNVLVEGTGNSSTKVWGVFSADGLDQYFLKDASIIQPENEKKIIQAIKNCTDAEAEKYEIIWYVIKMQHSSSSWWWSSGTSEWHIDGIIKKKAEISINYYGNGNTSGQAPDGITNHTAGDPYTVLGKNNMVKKINGVEVAFLGWSAKADGTGAEAGFYQPGDVIKPTQSLSLYAMWDTTTQHTATVNTYLDGVLKNEDKIHGSERDLYLGIEGHYHQLTHSGEGVYTAKITGNGKFNLYNKNADGTYTQVGTRQLTIYNQNGSMDVHHYSVTYDPNGGNFATALDNQLYYYDDTVNAITEVPTREGYRFLGWEYNNELIQPGEEVTASITAPIALTAKWEKTVNVTVNVTINHAGGDGYDKLNSRNEVSMALVSRENSTSPYLEVKEKNLSLSDTAHEGFTFSEIGNVTDYKANGYTFSDMPGGTTEYTVVTSKSGYDTAITATQNADTGDWVIDVVMTYNPSNFDLDFTVEVADSVPTRYIPNAAIVKVTFWSTDRQQWEIITQQEGGAPGVRVDIDHATRSGSGSYPVWKYESNGTTPYGYRIVVTSFVYPDGTIVPVNQVEGENEKWTDNVYTATMDPVTGGTKFGTLDGAYIGATDQEGTLNAVITMDLHNVTFDAQGGKVGGKDVLTLTEQYKIPSFKNYVPTREGGYIFKGWYLDAACTTPATEGADLTEDITLYAKWIEPLTISGTISIAGSYDQNGEEVPVNDIDRAVEAVVVLQEIRNGVPVEVNSKTVTFDYDEDHNAAAAYSFTGIPNDGKSYQIHVLELNYGTAYDNESDADSDFTANEYAAVFGDDNVADVDAHLTFVPPSYNQELLVDATQIGDGFKPTNVLAEVMYRDTGDIHPYKRISQHNVEPFGVKIGLNNGTGSGTQSIWKWHTDGMLYDYQMNISWVNDTRYDSETAPFYIVYDAPAYWNDNTNAPSGALKATLIPKQYLVSFDLNAGEDTVTGMDDFLLTYTDEEGNVVGIYGVGHTWSKATQITAVPQRTGYTFQGWETTAANVTTDAAGNAEIAAMVCEEVVLKAKWEKITYNVTTVAYPAEGGTLEGAGTYDYGSTVTIKATLAEGYSFEGWFENGVKVTEKLTHTIEKLTKDRTFEARFNLNQYDLDVFANPVLGGITTGDGTYSHGTKVMLTATANPGYTFNGWMNEDVLVSTESNYEVTVIKSTGYVANFSLNKHEVAIAVTPSGGGTVTGVGTYDYGTQVTLTATPKDGYTFEGWKENGTVISTDAEFKIDKLTSNRDFVAEFSLNQHEVAITVTPAGGGTVTGAGTYDYGTQVTLTATPKDGYTFEGWKENGTVVSTDAEFKIDKLTSNRDFVAEFSLNQHTVTTAVNPTGGGTVSGAGTYGYGSTVTIEATPAEGYTFLGWYENNALVTNKPTHIIENLEADRAFVAEFSLNQHTVNVVADPEAGGTVSGQGTYDYGTEVTISATANTGYAFTGWYVGGEYFSNDASFDVTVTQNLSYTAMFEPIPYSVTTTPAPAEGGTTTGDNTYFYGAQATVTATAKTGYKFVGWFENGAEVSRDAEYSFPVTGNHNLTAQFEQIAYQVTANAEKGGTAEGTAKFHYGDTATVKATVDATYTFDGWYEGTKKVSGALEYTFTVESDRELTAKFTKNGYNITTMHTDGGTTDGDGYYEEGETATVTATPQDGYIFIGWFENGAEVSKDAKYSFPVDANHTLKAEFAKAYTITTVASPTGAGVLTGGGKYASGTEATITAKANSNYYFVGWYNDQNELVTAEKSYTLNVLGDSTFTAKFETKKAYVCDYVYIFGYNDTQIGATGPLLRGELAQMIYRLVKQQDRSTSNGGNSFEDTSGEWFESGISYMAKVGAISGTKASPYAAVNRGETYKMICLGLRFTTDTTLNYSDYAAILKNSGYITGDGAVTASIKRYEFCALFNNILGRSDYCKDGFIDTEGNEVTDETYGYTDLKPTDSYYRTMMIATSTFRDGKIDLERRMERNTYDYKK